MADDKLKNLRGNPRRRFLKYMAAAGAALAVDRSDVLNIVADHGGYAMADEASCSVTNRSLSLVAGARVALPGFSCCFRTWRSPSLATTILLFTLSDRRSTLPTPIVRWYSPQKHPGKAWDRTGGSVRLWQAPTKHTPNNRLQPFSWEVASACWPPLPRYSAKFHRCYR